MEKRKPDHYVDNKQFLQHMIVYRERFLEAEEESGGQGQPTTVRHQHRKTSSAGTSDAATHR